MGILCGSVYLFGRYIAGVEPTEPGYSSYIIKPELYDMDKLSTTIQTVRGNINVDYAKNDNTFNVKVEGPDNGKLILPADGSLNVTVNGKVLTKYELSSDGSRVYEIGGSSNVIKVAAALSALILLAVLAAAAVVIIKNKRRTEKN